MTHIPVDTVSQVVADITQAAEDHNGAISTLIATENGFEGWWQGAIVAGLAQPPWSRRPGWDAANTTAAGLSMECTVEVADGRLVYSRRTGRTAKRVDIAVKAGGNLSRAHLIELKLLDGGFSTRSQLDAIEHDVEALRALGQWDDVASGWAVVLGMRLRDTAAFKSLIEDVCPEHRKGKVHLRELLLQNGGWACIAGLRIA